MMLQEMRIDGLQNVRVWETGDRDKPVYFYCKRLMDVGLTTLLLILLSPVMLLVALLIKLDTRGPVFFTQERVGTRRQSRNGFLSWEIHNLRMYKFRSMVHNAD